MRADGPMEHVWVGTNAALIVLPAAALFLAAHFIPARQHLQPLPLLPLLLPLLLLSMFCLVRASVRVPGVEGFAAAPPVVTCGNASAVNNLASLLGRPRAIWTNNALVPIASHYKQSVNAGEAGSLQQCIDWGRQDGFTAGNWDCSPTVAAGQSRCVKYKFYATGDTGVPPAASYSLAPARKYSTGFISTRGQVCMELTTKTNLCDYVNTVDAGVDMIKNEKTCLACKDKHDVAYVWTNGRCMLRPLTNAEIVGRDWKGAVYARNTSEVLPSSHSVRAGMFRVRNQFGQSACFAYTSSAVMEYHAIKAYNIDYRLSPQWIYDKGRGGRGISGMNITQITEVLTKEGVPADILDPAFAVGFESYVGIDFINPVTVAAAGNHAAYFKIDENIGVRKLKSVNDVKSALVNVGPVIISVIVFNHGDQPWTPTTLADPGGHSLVIDGYDDTAVLVDVNDNPLPGSAPGCFGVRNSWGKSIGQGKNPKGFTKMSYADFDKYVREAYVLTPAFGTVFSAAAAAAVAAAAAAAAAASPPPLSPWRPNEPVSSSVPPGDWWAGLESTELANMGTNITEQKSAAMRMLLNDTDNDFVCINSASGKCVMGKVPVPKTPGPAAAAFKPSTTGWETALSVNFANLSSQSDIRGIVWDR
jgi:hypothetical protein